MEGPQRDRCCEFIESNVKHKQQDASVFWSFLCQPDNPDPFSLYHVVLLKAMVQESPVVSAGSYISNKLAFSLFVILELLTLAVDFVCNLQVSCSFHGYVYVTFFLRVCARS